MMQSVHGAAAGREHRIEHVHARAREPRRQPLVVVDRHVLLLVAVHADVTDARIRQQSQEALDHPEPCAQHGDNRHLVAQPPRCCRLERRLDRHLLQRQLARDLHGHDRRTLEQRLAKRPVGCVAVAQNRELIR